MNIPNALTLLRLLLVPLLVILLMQGAHFRALLLLAFLGITDALDGFLARILKQQTALGAYLDPIADKTLITSCFIALAISKIIPGWLAVIVISRDIIILLGVSVLYMMSIPFAIRPAMVSKATTTFQILTVFFALAVRATPWTFDDGWMLFLYLATAILTVASGLHYIHRGIRYINQAPKALGPGIGAKGNAPSGGAAGRKEKPGPDPAP